MLKENVKRLFKWLCLKSLSLLNKEQEICQCQEKCQKVCLSKEEADASLANGATSGFWKALLVYIELASDTNKMMLINIKEGGIENKYMYMRGYIAGQRDVVHRVETAVRNMALREKENHKEKK